ncbi:MAG: hypothetical protein CMF62_00935 [Magnetococcales bacterium]|nr:hypothetical protein [Magnetococcales bacterium]|tara:strand:- start:19142 stop:20191 length:1050 start_codon:yes stop_codon:yes gene_type:complete
MTSNKEEFEKDCPDYPYISTIIPPVDRIIAIGDLHGDYNLTLQILKLTKIIDSDLNWIGKNTVVVQVGDQVDRCRPYEFKCDDPRATLNDEASDYKIMKFLTDLNEKAKNDGGKVISLLGNHELMNVKGNMNYVSYLGLEEFNDYEDPNDPTIKFNSGKEARIHAFAKGNEIARFMGCTRLSAVIVGDFLFAHAGIIPQYAEELELNNREDIEKLNSIVRKWLLGHVTPNYIDKIVGSSKNSMFWNRVLGNIPNNKSMSSPDCQLYVKPVLDLFDLKGMIVGHTPQFTKNNSGISKTCDNSVLRADFGGSDAFSPFDNDFNKKTKKRSVLRRAMAFEIINNKEIKVIGV